MILRASLERVKFFNYSDKVMSYLHRLIVLNRTPILILLETIECQLLSAMRLFQYNLLHFILQGIRVNLFSKTIMPYAQSFDQKYIMLQDIFLIEQMLYYLMGEREKQIFLQLHDRNINYVFLVVSQMKLFLLSHQRKSKTLLEVSW